MKKISFLISTLVLALVIFSLAENAWAVTIQAASCSQEAVQAAINSAANGDTVLLPPGTICIWSSGVTIPNSKGITLNGNASTITRGAIADYTGLINIATNPATTTRIMGFNFKANAPTQGFFINVNGLYTDAKFRIDNNTFIDLGTGCGSSPSYVIAIFINMYGVYGVINSNTFNGAANAEMIHNAAYGPGDPAGWTNDVVQGSDQAVYVEGNNFTNTCMYKSGSDYFFVGNSSIQNYYGARTVFRYNTLTMSEFDAHGATVPEGTRWVEIYNNSFHDVVNGYGPGIVLRGGSGVVFNNKSVVVGHGAGGIELQQEITGVTYPARDQVGRGKNQTLDPAYFWDNDGDAGATVGASFIQENRDYYNAKKSGYAPYACPHPLTGFTGSCNPSIAGTAGYNITSILYGDVSGDGTISAYDASMAAQYAVGLISLTTDQKTKADVSGDGTVSAYDASLIAQYAVGLITKFPIQG